MNSAGFFLEAGVEMPFWYVHCWTIAGGTAIALIFAIMLLRQYTVLDDDDCELFCIVALMALGLAVWGVSYHTVLEESELKKVVCAAEKIDGRMADGLQRVYEKYGAVSVIEVKRILKDPPGKRKDYFESNFRGQCSNHKAEE